MDQEPQSNSQERKRRISSVRRDLRKKKREVQKLASGLSKVKADICSISQEMIFRSTELWDLQVKLNGILNRADERAILARVQRRVPKGKIVSRGAKCRCGHLRGCHNSSGCDAEVFAPDSDYWRESTSCPCVQFEELKDV